MIKKPTARSILCISDTHFPYEHPDTIKFLAKVKQEFRPDCVVHLGDEVDCHSLSFHDHDPDLPSAGGELLKAIEKLKPLYRLFPEVHLIESNHGSMAYRKAKHHGIPVKYLKSYNDVLDAPAGWSWHDHLVIETALGPVAFYHGVKANVLAVSKEKGMSVVQGHYHKSFSLEYWATPDALKFAMQVGCSINTKSLAFAYDKVITHKPMIGHGIIVNGAPRLLPMVLNRCGRWVGKLV